MVYIEKQPCPQALREEIARLTDTPRWKELPEAPDPDEAKEIRRDFFDRLDKPALREALLREQHGLCAYCMKQIRNTPEETTLEHWYPLSKSKSGALDYRNLLAVCKGGEGGRVTCCDTKKGDSVLTVTPLDADFADNLVYHSDGEVDIRETYATKQRRTEIRRELRHTLHLNGRVLNDGSMIDDTDTGIVRGRRNTYAAFDRLLQQLYEAGLLTPEWLEGQLEELTAAPQREEYVGVKLFLIKQYL